MSKRYLVTHTKHFIAGRMVYPDRGADSITTLPAGVKPGRWLVPLDEAPVITGGPGLAARYIAKHVGGGHYHVEGIDDGERSSVLYKRDDGDAKAKAEAEAARLNAGGDLQLEADDPAPLVWEGTSGGTGDDDLPDA